MKETFKQKPEDVVKLEKSYNIHGVENGYVLEKNGTCYYSETLESALAYIKGHFDAIVEDKPEGCQHKNTIRQLFGKASETICEDCNAF